jgi:DNA-binding GntR family transcriptional regulator
MARAADVVYQNLRQRILAGEPWPGGWLREEEIAAASGVSRTPVREALRRLEAEGLVEIHAHRGAVPTVWDESDLDEVFELRYLLEGYAVRRAAQRYRSGTLDVEAMQAMCDRMEQCSVEAGRAASEDLTALNLRFHVALHEGAGNRQLVRLLSGVIQTPLVRHTLHQYTAQERARSHAHHREILHAIVAGDGDWAESVMRSHVRNARDSLRGAQRSRG